MHSTAMALCKQIDGARLAYQQSDEISVLISDWSSLQADPWFGNRVQKMVSVAASIATAAFNEAKMETVFCHREEIVSGQDMSFALFDARVFNVPHHEVVNYFIWRQQDCTRNSISSLAQAHFSHRQLHGKKSSDMQDMLVNLRGINWNDLPTGQKRGYCIVKKLQLEANDVATQAYHRWTIDTEIPIFSQDRAYVQKIAEEGIL